ncbi:MAG: hypothetical protein ACXACI_12595, partial [Candidatus Hodarchaeales archaeon]
MAKTKLVVFIGTLSRISESFLAMGSPNQIFMGVREVKCLITNMATVDYTMPSKEPAIPLLFFMAIL